MPSIDPAAAEVLRIVGAAVAGAVAGGLVGEWRAQAAEGRAEEREKKRLRQDQTLRAISETQRDYVGASMWIMRWLAGDMEGVKAARQGYEHYPDANLYLIGDETLIRQVVDLRDELHSRPFRSGVTAEDAARLGAQMGHVSTRLAAQRERVMNGQEPIWPSVGFVKGMLDLGQARWGVPPEYRPPIKDE